jgi:hypothetical protein
MSEEKVKDTATKTTTRAGRNRVWIVRLLGLFLLLVQGTGLIWGGVYYFKSKPKGPSAEEKKTDSNKFPLNDLNVKPIDTSVDARLYKSIFNPIGALIGLSALAFFLRFRSGWLCALLLQGVILYLCLSLYFSDELVPVIYPIMLYGIFMVLFLNSGAVRKVFLPRTPMSRE